MTKPQIFFSKIHYTLNKNTFAARRLKEERAEELGLHLECECGQMRCIDKKIYRCMPDEAGNGAWYVTNEKHLTNHFKS